MKIAIIGYGGMGHWHGVRIKSYNELGIGESLELKGVYDINEERCKLAKSEGYVVYSSANEIWEDSEIEAVIIATPNDVHIDYVKQASKAKKHVICEKPVSMNSQEAIEMFDVAESEGVNFEVHQNRRWDEDYLTVKNIYDNNLIGDVYLIESRVMGGNGIPGAWRKEIKHGGGMMYDWGVHLIDQMYQMINANVTSVYSEYSYIYGEEVEDGFALTANFDNGVKYRIVVATDSFRNLPRWQVYGTKGTATINDWDITGGVTTIVDGEENNVQGIKAGNGLTKTMAPRSSNSINESELSIVKAKPYEFYRNFVKACRKEEEPYVKRDEVVRVFKFMEACNESSSKNEVIKDIL